MKSEQLFRSPTGRVVGVRVGFSWPAFFLGPLWAIVKRSWLLFIALLVTFGILVVVDEVLVQRSNNILVLLAMLAAYLAYMIICGIYGNRWLEASLIRRGFTRIHESDA